MIFKLLKLGEAVLPAASTSSVKMVSP